MWRGRHFLTLRLRGAAAGIRASGLAHIDELVHRWSPGWNFPPGEADEFKRTLAEPAASRRVLDPPSIA